MSYLKFISVVLCLTVLGTNGMGGQAKYRKHSAPTSTSSCGANCLFALHVVMGDIPPDIGRIANECDINHRMGIRFLDLKEYLVEHRFDVYAERIVADEINNSSYYIIPIRTNGDLVYNHYILLLNRSKNRLKYYDGKGQVKEFSISDLSKIWDGECLRIAKDIKKPELNKVEIEFVFVGGESPFYVSKRRVTSEQYSKFISNVSTGNYKHTYCWEEGCSRNHVPKIDNVSQQEKDNSVNGASWFDGYAFCKWLGPEFQLPTKKQYLLMMEYNKKISHLSTALPNDITKDKSNIDNDKHIPISGLFSDMKELMLNNYKTNEENTQSLSDFRKVLLFDATGLNDSSPFGLCGDDEICEKIGFRVVKTR